MNEDVINCIPSKTMREYLTANPIELNVLQKATIVSEYATKRNRLPLFEKLLERAKTKSKRLLLVSYVEDLRHDESGKGYYYVGGLPLLIPERCDFSDECYLCYSLSYPIKTERDLIYCHEHIDVCRAERASIKKLTPQQRHNYEIIKNLLLLMKIRRFNKGWRWTLMKRLLR